MVKTILLCLMMMTSPVLLASDISDDLTQSDEDNLFSFFRRVQFSQDQATSSEDNNAYFARIWEDARNAWYSHEILPHQMGRTQLRQMAEQESPKRLEAATLLWYSDSEEDKEIARKVFVEFISDETTYDVDLTIIIKRFKDSENIDDNKLGKLWNRQLFPKRKIKGIQKKRCTIL